LQISVKTHTTIQSLQSTIDSWRSQGQHIAFVPTMGGLHAGHLALVELAKQKADKVVVSIFGKPNPVWRE
jgi:pantothenate synthetase (EC 6.3.2.1)